MFQHINRPNSKLAGYVQTGSRPWILHSNEPLGGVKSSSEKNKKPTRKVSLHSIEVVDLRLLMQFMFQITFEPVDVWNAAI